MSYFIGLDWGTTIFRAYLMESEKKVLCDKRVSPAGMSTLNKEEVEKYLLTEIQEWLQLYGEKTVVIGSGMIGSDMGLEWIDYVNCPCQRADIYSNIQRAALSSLNLYLVPGLLYCNDENQIDSLRGEESQLLGLPVGNVLDVYNEGQTNARRNLLCMPGTHSKWLEVQGHNIQRFRSALTGELYACLATSSLVRGDQQWHPGAFQSGVESGSKNQALLSALFQVRSHSNFQKIPSAHTQCFLSGLLIATEINDMLRYFGVWENSSELTIVGACELANYYLKALDIMGLKGRVVSDVEACSRGFLSIYQYIESTSVQRILPS